MPERRHIVKAMRRWIVLVCMIALGTGCADPVSGGDGGTGPPSDEGATAPTDVVLTCRDDGSTELSSDVVQAQSDGVHLEVMNEYDEPVSVEGFDADPGRSTWVFTNAPGTMHLMCWPFSQHGSGEEPSRIPLMIVDAQGTYVDGRLTCDDQAGMSGSYGEMPIDETPSLDEARQTINGLRADDVVLFAGYPEQERRPVVVLRDGEVVGSFSLSGLKGGRGRSPDTWCAPTAASRAAGPHSDRSLTRRLSRGTHRSLHDDAAAQAPGGET